jgi:hypothetical protein
MFNVIHLTDEHVTRCLLVRLDVSIDRDESFSCIVRFVRRSCRVDVCRQVSCESFENVLEQSSQCMRTSRTRAM